MNIKSKIKSYQYEFVDNVLDKEEIIFDRHADNGCKYYFFIDENILNIYEEKIREFVSENKVFVISASENNKDYLKLAEYFDWLIENKFTRQDVLITIGGGILQDISGFIASTLYRGIKWTFIPTTLLSQADSCIGSKTSINFKGSKNLIGTYFPPDKIFIDTEFCRTLSPEYFNSGLGEIIKFHLQSDSQRYTLLKKYLSLDDLMESPHFKEIIKSTLEIKYSYFEGDEFDSGRRNLLNYGHCFGHALEAATNFAVSHGEAVIVGMGFANLLSLQRGVMTKEKYDEFEEILMKHYPRYECSKVNVDDIIMFLKRDKKRVGNDLTMILSQDIGKQIKINDIKEKEIKDVYHRFFAKYPRFKKITQMDQNS